MTNAKEIKRNTAVSIRNPISSQVHEGSPVISHAGCIAADVGRAFSRVCMSVCLYVHTLKEENGLSYQHQTRYTYTL